MRVALACPYDWDAPGGVQVQVRQLALRLGHQGHQTLVLAPSSGGSADEGVTVVGRPARIRYQGTVAPICFSPASWVRVGRALHGFRPDVVHAHEPTTPSTGMFASLRSTVPVVATFHAHVERSRLLSAAAPLLRLVWRRLAVRIAVSEAARGFYASRFDEDIRIVPNGCDVDLFAAGRPAAALPEGRRMLWVGRLDPQKGFPVAVAAFAQLRQDHPDLSFIVLGEGRDLPALDRLPPDARAAVQVVGRVPHERLPDYYAGADVYVAPALGQESFGIVLVEAMAAGAPVVASDIAGYREVVRDGAEGLLVPPNDPSALAGAVRRVLDDPALAGRLSGAGRQRAREYGWDRVVTRIEAAYDEAIQGHARNGAR